MNLWTQLQLQRDEQIAIQFEHRTMTYRMLRHRIRLTAETLRLKGVKRGDHVAIAMENSPGLIEALYSIWTLGAVAVPLNPAYTEQELAYIMKDGDVTLTIVEDGDFKLPVPIMRMTEVGTIPCEVEATHSLAMILYTSGTTGKPKGTMLSHANLFSNARDVATFFTYEQRDRFVVTLPLFHVFALTVVLNAPLFVGATLLLIRQFSPSKVSELIERERATIFAGVPLMYNYILQACIPMKKWATIRLAISGGSPLPKAVHDQFMTDMGIAVSEGYGLSEASPVVCFNPIGREKVTTVGTTIPNVEAKIIDEGCNEVLKGHVGELCIKGPNVMQGYYKNEVATREAFAGDYLRTGDLAKIDEEGYVTIIDRKKDVILVGGYNVYPKEVEEVLYAHPSVIEAAVIGRKSEQLDEEVVAYVVANKTLTVPLLNEYCAKQLVRYKCPRHIIFCDTIPKNSTGKMKKYELK